MRIPSCALVAMSTTIAMAPSVVQAVPTMLRVSDSSRPGTSAVRVSATTVMKTSVNTASSEVPASYTTAARVISASSAYTASSEVSAGHTAAAPSFKISSGHTTSSEAAAAYTAMTAPVIKTSAPVPTSGCTAPPEAVMQNLVSTPTSIAVNADTATLSFGIGERVKISGLPRHDGKLATVEQIFDDGHVQVKLEGPAGAGRLSLSQMHLVPASGASTSGTSLSAVAAGSCSLATAVAADGYPLKAKIRELPRATGLQRGDRVRFGGQTCPTQFAGKVGYVDTADIGDGTGRVRVRLEAQFSEHAGYITTGGTFGIEVCTVEEAKGKCAMLGGKGFTFQNTSQGAVKVYFKNKWDLQGGPGSGWTSYRCEEQAGSKWMLASPIHLEKI